MKNSKIDGLNGHKPRETTKLVVDKKAMTLKSLLFLFFNFYDVSRETILIQKPKQPQWNFISITIFQII
jgi:hypothetical protein